MSAGDTELCLPFIDSLEDYREHFAQMTSCAVEARYPGDFFEPSREEAESSLAAAEKIFNFISRKISS